MQRSGITRYDGVLATAYLLFVRERATVPAPRDCRERIYYKPHNHQCIVCDFAVCPRIQRTIFGMVPDGRTDIGSDFYR